LNILNHLPLSNVNLFLCLHADKPNAGAGGNYETVLISIEHSEFRNIIQWLLKGIQDLFIFTFVHVINWKDIFVCEEDQFIFMTMSEQEFWAGIRVLVIDNLFNLKCWLIFIIIISVNNNFGCFLFVLDKISTNA